MRILDLYPYLAVDFLTHKNLWSLFSKPTVVSPKKIPSFQNIETQTLVLISIMIGVWCFGFQFLERAIFDLSTSVLLRSLYHKFFFFETIASPFNCILTDLFSFYTNKLLNSAVTLPNNIKTQTFWENKHFDRESKNPKQKWIKSKPTQQKKLN